ncbi:hypothetical protein CYY_005959 [Polysphondylium violaceum]|uniref:Uncharacterized protein n=1 Tax=Polysphondylium violaceum TaxID=133409 RepID=A0A8J4UZA1_9MYCE|nr:hypothetical protein CYY_005959 [Polysphondylium violaceum]
MLINNIGKLGKPMGSISQSNISTLTINHQGEMGANQNTFIQFILLGLAAAGAGAIFGAGSKYIKRE